MTEFPIDPLAAIGAVIVVGVVYGIIDHFGKHTHEMGLYKYNFRNMTQTHKCWNCGYQITTPIPRKQPSFLMKIEKND